ncbi:MULTISPECIES: hypothetical protein [Aeromonas]|uniref:hypothetical protein n=1 Tax=Aeromonas TaxID=642 RepID=UPI001F3FED59|nr:hypothetical protein [Aeromonas salmonicida]MCE9932474.1 hypothetical protein [Aeromonas salmonicida]
MTQEKKDQGKVVGGTPDKGQSQDRNNVKKGYQPSTRTDNSAEKPINPPPKKP